MEFPVFYGTMPRFWRSYSASLLLWLLAGLLTITRPASSAAASAGSVVDNIKGTPGELSLAPGAGWDDWQVIRDQHADHSTIRVFVRKGETAASAKVRLVLAQ